MKCKRIVWHYFRQWTPTDYDYILLEDIDGNRDIAMCPRSGIIRFGNFPMGTPFKFCFIQPNDKNLTLHQATWILENGDEIKLADLYDHEPLFQKVEES